MENEDYIKLQGLAGEGGFGKVYIGLYNQDNTKEALIPSAIKVLPIDMFDPNEIEIHSELSKLPKCNEHIACLYTAKKVKDNVYLVMELMKGGDLYSYISNKAPLSTSVLRDMFKQILEGLIFIHSQGISHLDIKLENIMVKDEENNEAEQKPVFKFIDFGFACRNSEGECINSAMPYGTNYLSTPEYFNSNLKSGSSEKADVWALGSTFLEILIANKNNGHHQPLSTFELDGEHLKTKIDDSAIVKELLTQTPEYSHFIKVISEMMNVDAIKRISAAEALEMLNFIPLDQLGGRFIPDYYTRRRKKITFF